MGIIQKDAFRTMLISYGGIGLGYINKGLLFLLILTTEQIGLINLMISVGMLFAQFANLGTIYTTWKFLPYFKNKEKKHHGFLPLILLIVFLGILICSILALVFKEEIGLQYKEKSALFNDYYIWILPIGISYVLFSVLEVYLRSFYKNIISAFSHEILLRLALTFFLALLALKLIDFNTFVIAQSLIYVIPVIILLVYLKYLNELNFNIKTIQISKRFKKIIFQFSAYNYINTLGTVLVNSLDVMMIAQMVGLKATGVYATVVFLASALQVPYKSIIRISSPLIADYWRHRELTKMKELYQKVSSVSLIIGLASFIIIWLNIDFLFSFLKAEFHEGIWVFFFIMMGRLLDMYFGLNGSIFTTSKKYKFDMLFTLFLIFAVIVLNLYFIPWWGISGAAISTSIALIIYNLGRVIFVWVTFKIHPFHVNQFIIIGLGLMLVFIGEMVNGLLPHYGLRLVIHLLSFFLLFVLPIYKFNLEPEIINYINKGLKFLNAKTKRK